MDEILTIDLFGEQFKFKPDEKVENPGNIVKHLNKYIREAQELLAGNKMTEKNKQVVLLLAAMNLAKDFQELRTRQNRLEAMFNRRISSIVEKIDKGIELF